MSNRKYLVAMLGIVVVATAAFWTVSSRAQGKTQELVNEHKVIARLRHDNNGDANGNAHPAGNARPSSNGISWHGGPVMTGTPTAYFIWYGNWSQANGTDNAAGQSILTSLAQSIGGSPYFGINKTYYAGTSQTTANSVSGAVAYGGSTTVGYTHGTSLSDAVIQQVVFEAINASALPYNTNGVYFVLTSSDVTASSGFCTNYCGWHTAGTLRTSGDIKYSFVGNAARCPASCEAQTTSPNGNAGADAMASIFAHELEEAVTDPNLNAWYDTRGQENADKCAWTFGTTFSAANGSKYNVILGNTQYLIQRNWVNASGGFCSMQ
jgi:hypothetical protein